MVDVIWPGPPDLTGTELHEALRTRLMGRVDEAYVFGSHARGQANQYSDIDLILVCDTDRPWPERSKDFADLWDEFHAVDMLIYTKKEWEQLQKNPTGFLEKASEQWKRVL